MLRGFVPSAAPRHALRGRTAVERIAAIADAERHPRRRPPGCTAPVAASPRVGHPSTGRRWCRARPHDRSWGAGARGRAGRALPRRKRRCEPCRCAASGVRSGARGAAGGRRAAGRVGRSATARSESRRARARAGARCPPRSARGGGTRAGARRRRRLRRGVRAGLRGRPDRAPSGNEVRPLRAEGHRIDARSRRNRRRRSGRRRGDLWRGSAGGRGSGRAGRR